MGNWWLFDAWEMKFSLFLLTLVGSSSGAVQIGSCMPEETGLIVERRSYECFPPENIENRASRCSVSRSVCGCNEVNTTTTGYWEWIDTFHGPEVWARSGEGGWDCWEYYCSRQENWYAKGTTTNHPMPGAGVPEKSIGVSAGLGRHGMDGVGGLPRHAVLSHRVSASGTPGKPLDCCVLITT